MVVEAVFHFWPSLSKATTFHDWRAAERGEQAGARAQPRARALSPHGQPVRRAGSEKVFATCHRFEKTRKESQVKGSQNELGKIKGGPAQCGLGAPRPEHKSDELSDFSIFNGEKTSIWVEIVRR